MDISINIREKIEYDTAMNSSQLRYFSWNPATYENILQFTDQNRCVKISELKKFKSYSAFSVETVPPRTIQRVRLRLVGGTFVQLGVSMGVEGPPCKAFCDF